MVKNTPIDVSSLKGAYVALITPMKFDDPSGMFNSIDYDKLEQLIEDQIDAGIDGILVNGTTGQSPTLDKSEIVQLSKRSCEIINGRVPLMVGAGSNSTNTAVQLTNAVEREIDSTTFLHVTGPYNKPTPEGLRRHFKMIANHFLYSETNIVLYDVPSRTGVPLSAELVIELAKDDRFIGIKYASTDLDRLYAILDRTFDEQFNVVSGEDGLVAPMMRLGATGVISAVANVAPSMFRELTRLVSGDYAAARKIQEDLYGVIGSTFFGNTSNPEALGYLFDSAVRSPLTPLTAKFVKEAQARGIDILMEGYTSEQLGIDLSQYRRS